MVANPAARKPAKVNPISKNDAMKAILSGELEKTNRFRRPCHLCGVPVAKEEGVLGGSTAEGWWAAHKDGACFTPEKKAPVKKATGSASASKKSAAKSAPAVKVDEPNVPVRGTGKRNSNMAAAKNTTARRTTTRAAVKPTTTAAKPTRTPVKPTTPTKRKTAVTKPAESASTAPTADELPEDLKAVLDNITTAIANGTFDAILPLVLDAIDDRLDAVNPPAAKTTAAKKTTVAAADKSAKLAPVKRTAAKPAAEEEDKPVIVPKRSASASTAVKPRKGFTYQIKPGIKLSSAGQMVKFMSYVPDTDNAKAVVTLVEEFKNKPAGFRFNVPVRALVKPEA